MESNIYYYFVLVCHPWTDCSRTAATSALRRSRNTANGWRRCRTRLTRRRGPSCRSWKAWSPSGWTLPPRWPTSLKTGGCRDGSVVRAPDSWLKGLSFESLEKQAGFCFLCSLLFWYLFHPRVTTVACKRFGAFCQKCRYKVTAKHTNTIYMWLCMKWCDMVHGCMVDIECTETAAVWHGTRHVSNKQCRKRTTEVDIPKHALKS